MKVQNWNGRCEPPWGHTTGTWSSMQLWEYSNHRSILTDENWLSFCPFFNKLIISDTMCDLCGIGAAVTNSDEEMGELFQSDRPTYIDCTLHNDAFLSFLSSLTSYHNIGPDRKLTKHIIVHCTLHQLASLSTPTSVVRSSEGDQRRNRKEEGREGKKEKKKGEFSRRNVNADGELFLLGAKWHSKDYHVKCIQDGEF